MKKIIIGLSFVLSSSVFSCPDLSGEYQCKGEEGEYKQVIEQVKNETGVTVLTVTVKDDIDSITVDDTWKELENEDIPGASFKASCNDTELILSVQAVIKELRFAATTTIKLENNELTSSTFTTYGEQRLPDANEKCTKM